MPRIRKKTSKRGTTHQRAKIKQKVAESRRKNKKAAKKNTQWKSKKPKDPGIPNSFPFKAQILAEIAEQRRQEEEERQKRKEQRRAEKIAVAVGKSRGNDEAQAGTSVDDREIDGPPTAAAAAAAASESDDNSGDESDAEAPEDTNHAAPDAGFDGISSLPSITSTPTPAPPPTKSTLTLTSTSKSNSTPKKKKVTFQKETTSHSRRSQLAPIRTTPTTDDVKSRKAKRKERAASKPTNDAKADTDDTAKRKAKRQRR